MSPTSALRHVVWDWNGTLVDDFAMILEAASSCCEWLRGTPLDADEYRTHFTRPVQTFYETVVGRRLTVAEWEQVNRSFHETYMSRLDGLRLAPGAREALEDLRRRSISQSVLSMWQERHLVAVIERLGIADFFVTVRGKGEMDAGDDHKAEHLIGHLQALERALRQPVEPSTVVLIGDSLDDAAAAREVGARCVLVEGGSHHPHHLAAAGVPVARDLVGALHAAGA
jgi:phosphoglycolate phosphatase-like HAD superfamily hydrolase